MLYYIDKNWYHFIKEYPEKFLKFAFQMLLVQSGEIYALNKSVQMFL